MIYFFFSVLGIKPRRFHMSGKYSAIGLHAFPVWLFLTGRCLLLNHVTESLRWRLCSLSQCLCYLESLIWGIHPMSPQPCVSACYSLHAHAWKRKLRESCAVITATWASRWHGFGFAFYFKKHAWSSPTSNYENFHP